MVLSISLRENGNALPITKNHRYTPIMNINKHMVLSINLREKDNALPITKNHRYTPIMNTLKKGVYTKSTYNILGWIWGHCSCLHLATGSLNQFCEMLNPLLPRWRIQNKCK